jgi:hypothetical protein
MMSKQNLCFEVDQVITSENLILILSDLVPLVVYSLRTRSDQVASSLTQNAWCFLWTLI